MKKMKPILIFALAITMATVILSCGSSSQKDNPTELKGNISISGAFALYPMATTWAEEFQKIHPGVKIDISAGGAGKGMADVLSGMVDLAMFSRSVSQEEISKGAWYIAVARDAVLPTVNAKNPFLSELKKKGMTKQMFKEVFLSEKIVTWNRIIGQTAGKSGSIKVNVFTRSDACGAAEMWGKYLDSNQDSLQGVGVFGDPGIASAVKNDVNAIGYNNLNYAFDVKTRKVYDGLEIIPLDINADGKIDSTENFYNSLDNIMKAISTGLYPSPPARDLYFISKGKPENQLVLEFLKWVMTDGQKFVDEAGYVKLPNEQFSTENKKLE
jgi:phosphate transport system substrate-binding protein